MTEVEEKSRKQQQQRCGNRCLLEGPRERRRRQDLGHCFASKGLVRLLALGALLDLLEVHLLDDLDGLVKLDDAGCAVCVRDSEMRWRLEEKENVCCNPTRHGPPT